MASVLAGMDLVGLSAADELVVHGGDMARATGQHYQCQPELLDAANRFLVQFASPGLPAGPEVPFGPSRAVAGDASLLDRVLALAGREPAWPAG